MIDIQHAAFHMQGPACGWQSPAGACFFLVKRMAAVCCLADGDALQQGVEFGVISGSARSILIAERICLNFMQRMSGIATATAAMVAAAAGHKAR